MVETTILPDMGQKRDDMVVRGRYGRVGGVEKREYGGGHGDR